MTDPKRGDIITASASPLMNMFRKGLLHGAGYSTDRISKRPLIAMAHDGGYRHSARQPGYRWPLLWRAATRAGSPWKRRFPRAV